MSYPLPAEAAWSLLPATLLPGMLQSPATLAAFLEHSRCMLRVNSAACVRGMELRLVKVGKSADKSAVQADVLE